MGGVSTKKKEKLTRHAGEKNRKAVSLFRGRSVTIKNKHPKSTFDIYAKMIPRRGGVDFNNERWKFYKILLEIQNFIGNFTIKV